MPKITTKYIRENFDLDAEREQRIDTIKLGEIKLSLDGLNITSVLSKVADAIKDYPEHAYIETEAYGYDGAEDICVYEKVQRDETDSEVALRVFSREKNRVAAEQREATRIAEAKALLRSAGETL